MKKRILAGVLGLTLLAGIVTLAGAASQDRALVSLSYLNGAFWSDLKAVVKQEVDRDTSAIYSAAAGQVGQGGGTAGSFAPQSGVNGHPRSSASFRMVRDTFASMHTTMHAASISMAQSWDS